MSEDLKARLLKARVPEADVEIDGVGTVRVRGLTRTDSLLLREIDGTGAVERRMLSICLIDPVLTEDEVGEWQAAALMLELEPVVAKINELSGLTKASQKEAYKSIPDGSGSGV